ncbi:class I SAM-dependent methyltransferase [Acetatifactor muris]|nr:class I SAM-dependent methyltransferase [Acetatifactor muris]
MYACETTGKYRRKTVLDMGFGTGTLTSRLYQQGCHIWGQDFSQKMVEVAREKMPSLQPILCIM